MTIKCERLKYAPIMPPILTSYSKIGTGSVSNGRSRALCTNSAVSHNANERRNPFTQVDKSYVCQTTFLQVSSTGVCLSLLLFTSALPSKSPRYCVISNNLHIILSSPLRILVDDCHTYPQPPVTQHPFKLFTKNL